MEGGGFTAARGVVALLLEIEATCPLKQVSGSLQNSAQVMTFTERNKQYFDLYSQAMLLLGVSPAEVCDIKFTKRRSFVSGFTPG